MRLLRVGLVALVAVPLATAASSGSAAKAPPGCTSAAPTPATQLPATLLARTGRGLFVIHRDGSVCRLSHDPLPAPYNAGWWPNGAWIKSEHGHVVVGRSQRTLWRSAGRVPHASTAGSVVLGRHELAFSTDWRGSRLYTAPRDAREHFVARGEFPLGWTSGGGLYVARDRGTAIFLRNGQRSRRIGDGDARAAAYAPSTDSLYFVVRDTLYRARGARTKLVARLATFRLPSSRDVELQPLGRLLAVQSRQRLVVLRADGSLFAATSLPETHDALVSALPSEAPEGDAVAFAVLVPNRRIETQVIEPGVETVYLLRPGARTATPIHEQRLRFNVCGHGAEIAWQGRWLLYSASEGSTALINTTNGRTLELTSLIRRLPGFTSDDTGSFGVAWR